MGRPRKTKLMAAAAEASTSSPAFSIGNCKMEIHGNGLRCASTEWNLTIFGAKGSKIVIAVDGARSSSDWIGEGSDFILLNPNDIDSRNKLLLQEALMLYKTELPFMDYAADTGKKSGFLEKCIMDGKYNTLILRSTSLAGPEEIYMSMFVSSKRKEKQGSDLHFHFFGWQPGIQEEESHPAVDNGKVSSNGASTVASTEKEEKIDKPAAAEQTVEPEATGSDNKVPKDSPSKKSKDGHSDEPDKKQSVSNHDSPRKYRSGSLAKRKRKVSCMCAEFFCHTLSILVPLY